MTKLKTFGGGLRSFRTSTLPPPVKKADDFYGSAAWKNLLASIIRRRGRRCEDCGATGRIYGDHVVEISDGGERLDEANVRLRCAKCHGAKTAAARAARYHGTRQ